MKAEKNHPIETVPDFSDYGMGSQLTGDFAPDTLCPYYLPHCRG